MCLGKSHHAHHHRIAPAPTSSVPLPLTRTPGLARWRTRSLLSLACLTMSIDTILWPRRSHTRLWEISASVPNPPAPCHAMAHGLPVRTRSTTRTHSTTPHHHTVSNARRSDARCNDIGTRKLVHLSSYAHSYSAPCSSRPVP